MNFRKIYQNYSILIQQILSGKRTKLLFELTYWRMVKFGKKTLENDHYKYFFTDFFGLTVNDYRDKKIMDIGCGPRGSLEWATMTQERIGIDPLSNKYLKLGARNHKMKYVEASSENIPFEDAYFDYVSSFNSLDHVDDLTNTITELKRVIKKGGFFILISDVHIKPTICEPAGFSWDILNQFKPEFKIISEQHFEGNRMYKSLREGIHFDHNNTKERYGILTALLKKN